MASAEQKRIVALSHTPAALKKAAASRAKGYKLKAQLAAKYNLASSAFAKPSLLATCKAHGIPLSDLPVEIFSAFGAGERKRLLAQRAANGHAHPSAGVGIPLDAIPERKPRATGGTSYVPKAGRAHPNAELIGKVLDQLGREGLSPEVGERLLSALDKLLSG